MKEITLSDVVMLAAVAMVSIATIAVVFLERRQPDVHLHLIVNGSIINTNSSMEAVTIDYQFEKR